MNPDTIIRYVEHLETQMQTNRAIQHAAQRFGVSFNEVADLVYNDDPDGETYENRDFDHEAAIFEDFYGG